MFHNGPRTFSFGFLDFIYGQLGSAFSLFLYSHRKGVSALLCIAVLIRLPPSLVSPSWMPKDIYSYRSHYQPISQPKYLKIISIPKNHKPKTPNKNLFIFL
jgi:hypothetical protein